MSHDEEVMPDALAGLAASAAIQLSDFPFECAISEARTARINGEFVINPSRAQLEEADIDIMVGASKDSVMMVEGEMEECSEEEMVEAIKFAHEFIKKQCDAQEKLAPWMQPIFDNLELLINNPELKISSKRDSYHELMKRGMLIVEPLTYIRGRTIPNQYMIIDEAQNLTAHEVKTIITRVGENTKVVLTGDIEQIDNLYTNETSNGLTYAVERFKEYNLAGHVTFTKGERSRIATLASKII